MSAKGRKHKKRTPRERSEAALNIIYRFGTIDGAHHKQWVLDQVVRLLLDDKEVYARWKAGFTNQGYWWDEGIAP